MQRGLYIHVPFCRQRCHFCAFYLELYREERLPAYLNALTREIELRAQGDVVPGDAVQSVYFGGGTPTLLGADGVLRVLKRIRTAFEVDAAAEITLEVFPDSVRPDDWHRLGAHGVNRLSIGVQSMDHETLIGVGRSVEGGEPHRTVQRAREAGFSNINVDLIYGLPRQTLADWEETVAGAMALAPSHVSCYALTVEDKTRLAKDVSSGRQEEPDEERQLHMEQHATWSLHQAGFERYEVSNYAKPGHACRHNLLYWQGGEYLGFGPSAQSLWHGRRFGNVENLSSYQARLAHGELPVDEDGLVSGIEQSRDRLIFGLRLMTGVRLHEIGSDVEQWRPTIVRLTQRGWLEEDQGCLRLTESGRRFADSVALEFF